jgi:hypothetical protein
LYISIHSISASRKIEQNSVRLLFLGRHLARIPIMPAIRARLAVNRSVAAYFALSAELTRERRAFVRKLAPWNAHVGLCLRFRFSRARGGSHGISGHFGGVEIG